MKNSFNSYFDEKNIFDPKFQKQKKIFDNIIKCYKIVYKDFFEKYKNDEDWPSFINSFNQSDPHWDGEYAFSFLKYSPVDKTKDKIFKNFLENLQKDQVLMAYHTDTHEFDLESPGRKFIITITFYLNDNYEGGEISFLDEKQSKVINYKPEKGDIIVFPSGAPYYHGVFPVKTNERYVLRMFRFWNYEGSQKWHENKEKYGADDWNKIESERIKKAYDSGDYHRTVVFPGQKIDTDLFHTKLFYAKEKAILYKKEKNNNYE